MSSFVKEGYFLGFYFWLDLVATASMIFDIGWLWDYINGYGAGTNPARAASRTKASRGARVGTKAGRVTRVIRLIRLIRIVKLYKTA